MRKFALLLLAVLLVAGAWAGGWYLAAGEVRKLVASLGEGDGEANPKIT